MAEKESKKIEKAEKEIAKDVAKIEKKVEDKKISQKEADKKIEKDVEEKAEEVKTEEKAEAKKETPKKQDVPKKDLAIANAYSLKISPKQSKYVCRIIKGKSPENAAARLREVIDEKRAVPMAGLEVAHKKGMAGGKFPKNACKAILEVVKQLGANANMVGIEQPIITIAKADRGNAPYRRAGQKGKRTHIHLEARDKSKLVKKKK